MSTAATRTKLATTPAGYGPFDEVILSDVPASAVDPKRMQALADWVR